MLVVPPWFHQALREWIKIALPHSVSLSAWHFCDEWVQVTYYGGKVALCRNWPETVYKYDLHRDNVMAFKLQAFDIKMMIYKADSSTAGLYTCH
jgi:hypothetical protein